LFHDGPPPRELPDFALDESRDDSAANERLFEPLLN